MMMMMMIMSNPTATQPVSNIVFRWWPIQTTDDDSQLSRRANRSPTMHTATAWR
jgi:hypothetical protein